MTQYLPPNLLALFAPRDPIPFLSPLDKLPHEKKSQNYHGVADFLKEFEDPKDTPPPTRVETKDEKKERKRKERAEQVAYKLEQDLALWDPSTDVNSTGDPYKTLFVARTNYDTSESKLRREFEQYGPVKSIFLATNQRTGKPRGFAFVEFEHERDMHSAYKHADGKKIDGRRVLVDIERGRTIKGWRPRRLGGGLGGTRKGGPDVNAKYSGRDDTIARERSRSPKGGDRERSRTRSPRRRKRSRSRERRRRRSRSKDRTEKRRSRSPRERPERPDRSERPDRPERSERRRSRSRDRKRRRSRSREARRRSRSPRERRPAPEEPAAEPVFGEPAFGAMPDGREEIMTFSIKQEPDYTGYGDSGASGDQTFEGAPPGFANGNGEDAANE